MGASVGMSDISQVLPRRISVVLDGYLKKGTLIYQRPFPLIYLTIGLSVRCQPCWHRTLPLTPLTSLLHLVESVVAFVQSQEPAMGPEDLDRFLHRMRLHHVGDLGFTQGKDHQEEPA